MRARRVSKFLAVMLASSCADATDPGRGTPGIRFLAGVGQADTVDAILPQALVVELRDTLGYLKSGEIVRFQGVPDGQALGVASLSGEFSSLVAETTHADGQVAVLVRLGVRAGTALLQVSVPIYGWVDTAEFTVGVGGPAAVLLQPLDTAIMAGDSFPLRAWVADRHANPRPDPVTYLSFDTTATVEATGLVTGRVPGTARFVARAAGMSSDTSRVRVGPEGTIVASTAGGVAVVNLDGSGYRALPIANARYGNQYPSWLADTAIAASDGAGDYARLVRVSLSGLVQYLVPSGDTLVVEVWPQAAHDASWIYFSALAAGYTSNEITVWRVHPDGSSLERVSPPIGNGESDTYPSPSPDGSRLAVATTRFGGFKLAVIDLASGQLVGLGVPGVAPRWAPAGDTIAYVAGPGWTEIWLVDASGGGARRVTAQGRAYELGLDWSPDRRWIIARAGAGLELVEVATGRIVSLPSLPFELWEPAWRR